MQSAFRKAAAAATLSAAFAAPAALSHLDPDQFNQSFRQSYFALVGANFGPLAAMVKGEMPWDTALFQRFADDLATTTSMSPMRGFREGSEQGTTRAKPGIWTNLADFESKFKDLQGQATKLQAAAASGDEGAMKQQVGETGKTCKACHDEYKAKDYLY
jgi:cytochrome c556